MDITEYYNLFLETECLTTDSRNIPYNSLFIALVGERFDGNQFVEEALKKGAKYAITSNKLLVNEKNIFFHPDTLLCLQGLARHHRKQLSSKVIAIGGSNGKTTTKELLSLALSKKYKVFATPGNFNNHIGVPITILSIRNNYDFIILELGANHLNEHKLLCEISKPDFALITNNGKDHLEGFGSIEGVIKANLEIFDYTTSNNGFCIVNVDDNALLPYQNTTKNISYGLNNSRADYYAEIVERFPSLSINAFSKKKEDEVLIQSHLFGKVNAYNLLSVFAISDYFGVSSSEIKIAIETYIPSNNRSQRIEKESNVIILDAYNANPSSVEGVLSDFSDFPHPKKVLILGDMFELGENAINEHKNIINQIEPSNFFDVVLVGELYFLSNTDKKVVSCFARREDALTYINSKQYKNAIFLIKGSRGMKMEQIIEHI